MLELREDLRTDDVVSTDWVAVADAEKNCSVQIVQTKIRTKVVCEFINDL